MDFLSTPLLVTVILGSVGLAIPIIDSLKKERGANNRLYCGIAVGALILIISIIIIRVLSGEQIPTIEFGKGMLADDMFGAFFGITLLIVSIMVTVSSWDFMKNKTNPAAYYSLILLSSIGMILIAYSTDLVMLLVAWELMSIPTYALAAFSKRDPAVYCALFNRPLSVERYPFPSFPVPFQMAVACFFILLSVLFL